MHDGMPYGPNQGQGQGHSSEVDRQSPTGLIFFLNQEVNQKTVRCICSVWIMYSILLTGLTTRRWVRSVGGIQSELAKLGVTRRHALSRGSPRRMQYVPGPVIAAKCYLSWGEPDRIAASYRWQTARRIRAIIIIIVRLLTHLVSFNRRIISAERSHFKCCRTRDCTVQI